MSSPGGHEDRITIAKNDNDNSGGGGGSAPLSKPSLLRVCNLQEDDVDGNGGGVSGNLLLLLYLRTSVLISSIYHLVTPYKAQSPM